MLIFKVAFCIEGARAVCQRHTKMNLLNVDGHHTMSQQKTVGKGDPVIAAVEVASRFFPPV